MDPFCAKDVDPVRYKTNPASATLNHLTSNYRSRASYVTWAPASVRTDGVLPLQAGGSILPGRCFNQILK